MSTLANPELVALAQKFKQTLGAKTSGNAASDLGGARETNASAAPGGDVGVDAPLGQGDQVAVVPEGDQTPSTLSRAQPQPVAASASEWKHPESTDGAQPNEEIPSTLLRARLQDAEGEFGDAGAAALREPALRAPMKRHEEASSADEATLSTLGAAVLQSFLSQSSTVPVAAVPSATAAAAGAVANRVESLQSIIAETVSRILVSDPLHDARREVRVQFSPEVLPNTEVRLWRDEGRLHVEFASSSATSDGVLRDALPRLGEAIHQRQPEPQLPLVTLRSLDSGGQPHDGRSRQQYWLPQDSEEQA